jgi:hypothetical protein
MILQILYIVCNGIRGHYGLTNTFAFAAAAGTPVPVPKEDRPVADGSLKSRLTISMSARFFHGFIEFLRLE